MNFYASPVTEGKVFTPLPYVRSDLLESSGQERWREKNKPCETICPTVCVKYKISYRALETDSNITQKRTLTFDYSLICFAIRDYILAACHMCYGKRNCLEPLVGSGTVMGDKLVFQAFFPLHVIKSFFCNAASLDRKVPLVCTVFLSAEQKNLTAWCRCQFRICVLTRPASIGAANTSWLNP